MNWYTLISEPEKREVPAREMRFSGTERLTSPDVQNDMSLLGQFFVAPRVLIDGRTPVQIPLFDNEIREIVLQEIAPHFTSCKIMHFQGETKTIGLLTGVKPSSQELFLQLRKEGCLHPVIADLFRDGKPTDESIPSAYTLCEINKESVGVSEPKGFSELWSFFCNTTIKEEGHFTAVPIGWEFGEHLTNSLYVQALNAVSSHIRMYVDTESQRVRAISALHKV